MKDLKINTIAVDRIFLDQENPRHEPYQNQSEVIDYLCKDEYVFELAKDISKHGLNPLELFALIPQGEKTGKNASYNVAEGNRRMCAIKLLNDPELAPANKRKEFEKLAEQAENISEIQAVIFDNKDDVNLWLDRIHGGVQGGIGRKSWNAEQKTRHLGDKKNILAQYILDYAAEKKLITNEDRKGKLTTVQRYLSNPLMREALGLDSSNIEDISRNRSQEDFDLLLKQFLEDLKKGKVNSRSNAKAIEDYSRELGSIEGQTGKRVEPVSITTEPPTKQKKKKSSPPKKPSKPQRLPYEEDIFKKLQELSNYKLERIYYSVCSIHLEEHTSLISVGIWSFIESLTAKAGRNSSTDFHSFLSKQRLQDMGLGDGKKTTAIREAIKRISEFGNTTKHHETAANFNGLQLYNDMQTIKELILKLCEEIIDNNKK